MCTKRRTAASINAWAQWSTVLSMDAICSCQRPAETPPAATLCAAYAA